MLEYELFYLVGESKEGDLGRIKETVEKTVTARGGTFLSPETQEKRKLAYPVKKEIRGTYCARRFTMPGKDDTEEQTTGQSLFDINRDLQLSSDILRSLVVRAEDLPELKPIERVEKQVTNRTGRYERRGALRPMPQAPVAPKEEKKEISPEELDKQLKKQLDI
jgi:ribosomal protein S6